MPGSSSNHHLHTLPGLVIAIREMKVYGKAYAEQTISNAKALGRALDEEGVDVEAKEFGFTESHQLAVRVTRFGEAKKIAQLMGAVMKGKEVLQQVGRLREQFTEVQFC